MDLRRDTQTIHVHICAEVGLCAQKLLSILGSMLNIIDGDLYDHLMSEKWNNHFGNKFDNHMNSKNYKESGYIWPRFVNHLTLIACIVSCKKWVRSRK